MLIRVMALPVIFHEAQLAFKPRYEWAFGEKINHPETTARAESILTSLKSTRDFEIIEPREIPLSAIRASHSYNLMTLYNAARQLPDNETFYPSVFPKDTQTAADPNNIQHAGFFCYDSGTPLNSLTWSAATWSAACAREAAVLVRQGTAPLAYALSRPPGHHVSRDVFGGYSYFNNAAIAAKYLRRFGRVAILDIDYHHGNGTQSHFYRDAKVLTLSIHGDPRNSYPYFAGFSSETGAGAGAGLNLNFPMPRKTKGGEYLRLMGDHVLPAIRNFGPDYLIVSAGFDTYRLDPVGDFLLDTGNFREIGAAIGSLNLKTVVIQEGGYHTEHLGRNVKALLLALSRAMNIA